MYPRPSLPSHPLQLFSLTLHQTHGLLDLLRENFRHKETPDSGTLNLQLPHHMFFPRNQHALLPPFIPISVQMPLYQIEHAPSKIMPHPSRGSPSSASLLFFIYTLMVHLIRRCNTSPLHLFVFCYVCFSYDPLF